MTWHVVPAVKAGLREATERWPNRNKASDGTIGDVAHSNRTSDHNPDDRGAVLAFDLTHDPSNGCDAHALVRAAVDRRDRRIKYAISNGRIWSATRAAEGWRRYRGSNPHAKHVHVSVNRAHEDDTAPWWLCELGDRLLEQGATGPDVTELQRLLGVTADAAFGPATHAALVAFQVSAGLAPDGVCGPLTLAALREGNRLGGGTYAHLRITTLPAPGPHTPTKGSPSMMLILEPGSNAVWLCDRASRHKVSPDERDGRRQAGVPFLDDGAAGIKTAPERRQAILDACSVVM